MGTQTFAGILPVITETALERKALAGFRSLDLDGQAEALSLITELLADQLTETDVRSLVAGGAVAVGAATSRCGKVAA